MTPYARFGVLALVTSQTLYTRSTAPAATRAAPRSMRQAAPGCAALRVVTTAGRCATMGSRVVAILPSSTPRGVPAPPGLCIGWATHLAHHHYTSNYITMHFTCVQYPSKCIIRYDDEG